MLKKKSPKDQPQGHLSKLVSLEGEDDDNSILCFKTTRKSNRREI